MIGKCFINKVLLGTLTVALAFIAVPAAAQQGKSDKEVRSLPASASPPPDVVEQMERDKEKIPDPPAKGKGLGKALKASKAPPPDVAEQMERDKEQIPAPPDKAKQKDLVDKISKRPGGAERVDKARKGKKPEKAKKGQPMASAGILNDLASVIVRNANAGETFTLDLTPSVDSYGRHSGLSSSSPYGRAYLYCSYLYGYSPSNSSVRLLRSSFGALGHSCTNPFVSFVTNIPTAGYYIVNINASLYGSTLDIRHYENGQYLIIESLPRISGWADYPTLQYLEPGGHTFYFMMPSGGYVSRISVDSYP